MGATWIGSKHKKLLSFLKELGLSIFDQTLGERAIVEPISTSPPQIVPLPPNTHPTFRIKGGTHQVIQALANQLEADQIRTSQVINSIQKKDNYIAVHSQNTIYQTRFVVTTLPPNLFQKTIKVNPILPTELIAIMATTHTWMAESIKFVLTYETPFWRASNTSGTLVSNAGAVPELWDHSNEEDNRYGLKGFLNGVFFSLSKEERRVLILQQLKRYYGEQAEQFLSYEELVWRKEKFTFAPYEQHILPHQNNSHALYQQSYLEGQLWMAGAETSEIHPGYMDGAIRSAYRVFESLRNI